MTRLRSLRSHCTKLRFGTPARDLGRFFIELAITSQPLAARNFVKCDPIKPSAPVTNAVRCLVMSRFNPSFPPCSNPTWIYVCIQFSRCQNFISHRPKETSEREESRTGGESADWLVY